MYMEENTNLPQPVFSQPESGSDLPQVASRMSKFWGGGIIILAIVVGYIALANFEHWFPFGLRQNTTATTGIVTPAPSANSDGVMANWKTYRSDKFGFELKYPGDWEDKYNSSYETDIGKLMMQFAEFELAPSTGGLVTTKAQLLKEKNDISSTGTLVNGKRVKVNNFLSQGDYVRMATFFSGRSGNDRIWLYVYINPANFQQLKDLEVSADEVAKNPENKNIVNTFDLIVSTLKFF